MRLGTKAETLDRLRSLLSSANVLPLRYFTLARWRDDQAGILTELRTETWAAGPLIVRSSCLAEDQLTQSQAGHFVSLADVMPDGLVGAIETVIASYAAGTPEDQVLVQPMCSGVAASGVAFSRDPNTRSPYIVVNYEEGRGDTAAVTGGHRADLKTFVIWKDAPAPANPMLANIVAVIRELEALTDLDALDVEFASDAEGAITLFQVRPLIIPAGPTIDIDEHRKLLGLVAKRVAVGTQPDPFIHGRRTVYGVMPDWNPAEIIGVRPRPLALSLYRDLVTDATWAYQRHNYGYKNLRSCPLLVHFHGLPYIDVRVSFNSFIPASVDDDLADRLVNYYIDRLLDAPHLHDKVEFEIIFSCYTPTLSDKIKVLAEHGFRREELERIESSLRDLTNAIIHNKKGLWRSDLEKLTTLENRRKRLMESGADPITQIYWLLEDCKRYGSLPFAGLARAGFIAVQLLRSLVEIGVMTQADYSAFMSSLNSVSSRMGRDFAQLDRASFLSRYGHLRPGTYDILSARYDEAPDLYFDWKSEAPPVKDAAPSFALSLPQMRAISQLLEKHGIENDVVSFFEFLEAGIEGREYSKFIFTRNLSDAISMFRKFGEDLGFSADDMSYANISVVKELYTSSVDPRTLLAQSIDFGRQQYEVTRAVVLPPLISSPEHVWSFHMPPTDPNYITQKAAMGHVVDHFERERLAGAIVMIPNADPGFDWLFSFPIAGFITAYGGANSHMAIRAAELGLPAVIGAGDGLFSNWAAASVLSMDCANRSVSVVR